MLENSEYFQRLLPTGKCPPRKPLHKTAWSWVGAFLGILIIGEVSSIQGVNNLFLVGSFGASAVLIYGAPLAEFSQPRNLIGGHFLSAIVGVLLFDFLGGSDAWVAPLAVSISIVVMHFTRTLHPPGGATALIAVIGGEKVHALRYLYIFSPILVGAVCMLLVALFVNNMSKDPKRHYPVYWF